VALYLLSYDIQEKNHDYDALYAWLAEQNATRALYSEWLVPASDTITALQILEAARAHVMTGDKLFCCEIFNSARALAWTTNLHISSDDLKRLLSTNARTLS
jgi:hypothetical protein